MCTSPLRAFYTGSKTSKGGDLLSISKAYQGLDRITYRQACKTAREPFPINKDYMYMDGTGEAWLYKYVDVPCGKCDECRAAYAKHWAYRCMLEADNSQDCHFITLTYDDAHCPDHLDNQAFPAFMKRLRKIVGSGVRFFASSELGEHTKRPHFHALLFNCPLNIDGFSSPELRKAWPFGNILREDVTIRSCAYVARYCNKKIGDDQGRLFMSRRPGIGELWISRHLEEIARTGKVYFAFDEDCYMVSSPRYADKLLIKEGFDLTDLKDIRAVRMQLAEARQISIFKTNRDGLLNYRRSLAKAEKERKERTL